MIGLLASLILFAGCDRPERNVVQGYVEAEFVYVASPLAGALQSLHVRRGMQVQAATPLFELDSVPETAARDEAERKLAEAQANLEDVKKGKRPSEIESFTRAAVNAIMGSNPTEPLPPEYPDEKAQFTVTFYYNEQP